VRERDKERQRKREIFLSHMWWLKVPTSALPPVSPNGVRVKVRVRVRNGIFIKSWLG
jgi:hypothetical protein